MKKKLLKRLYKMGLLRSGLYKHMLQLYGVSIGDNTFIHPNSEIDITRPSLVTIGSNCYLNKGLVLLTHDYVAGVMRNVYHDFLNSSGKVVIGNNVGTGYNVTILKGVTIGDNCFIAANSLVTKDVPSNVIIGGQPARILCTLEEYYTKRKSQCITEALEYARSIKERFHRQPVASDFWEEFHLFIDNENLNDFDKTIMVSQLGEENFDKWLLNHKRVFSNLDDFLSNM